jgi:nucleotide-binding universal stress UspA family protein
VPWKVILVGTDGTERAGRAVTHAAGLAQAVSAELVVVTAYEAGKAGREETTPAELEWAATAATGAEDVARRAAELARTAGATQVRTRTIRALPAEGLAQVADDVRADLIVVGSKGMSSSLRFITGSVPNDLSHHVQRDLLIVQTV